MGGTLAAPTANQARAGGGIALSLSSRNYHHHQGLERRDTAAASKCVFKLVTYHVSGDSVGCDDIATELTLKSHYLCPGLESRCQRGWVSLPWWR